MSNKLVKKYPQLGSSANPEKLAMTFKGVAVAFIPLIIMLAKAFKLDIAESDVMDIINAIAALISAVMVLFGLVRKLYYKMKPEI